MYKPPIGIMPKQIWGDQRHEELRQAIYRYLNDGLYIPSEWVDEYNKLIDSKKDTEKPKHQVYKFTVCRAKQTD